MDPLKPPARRPSNYPPAPQPINTPEAPPRARAQVATPEIDEPKKHFPWLVFLLTLLITALVVGGGIYYWQQQAHQDEINTKQSEIDVLKAQSAASTTPAAPTTPATPTVTPYTTTSFSDASPDASHTVTTVLSTTGNAITVKDKAGTAVGAVVPAAAEISTMKIPPTSIFNFVGWSTATKFVVEATSASGSIYQFLVDATTAKADTASAKQIH